MARPKTVAQKQNDVSWDEILSAVEEKREYLESANRYYKGDHAIETTVVVQQESYPEKLIVLDEIKFGENNYQYRFGYWVVSDDKLKEGEISVVFGQFASVIPPEDIQRLFEKAKEADWNGPAPW